MAVLTKSGEKHFKIYEGYGNIPPLPRPYNGSVLLFYYEVKLM